LGNSFLANKLITNELFYYGVDKPAHLYNNGYAMVMTGPLKVNKTLKLCK